MDTASSSVVGSVVVVETSTCMRDVVLESVPQRVPDCPRRLVVGLGPDEDGRPHGNVVAETLDEVSRVTPGLPALRTGQAFAVGEDEKRVRMPNDPSCASGVVTVLSKRPPSEPLAGGVGEQHVRNSSCGLRSTRCSRPGTREGPAWRVRWKRGLACGVAEPSPCSEGLPRAEGARAREPGISEPVPAMKREVCAR
jgi:hypothetical protein